MVRLGLFAALMLAVPAVAAPAPDSAGPRAAIEQWFAALRTRDRAAFEALMQPEATFIALRKTATGWTQLRRTRADLIEVLFARQGEIVERFIATPVVLVDGPLATVWGRYDISLAGQRIHCGTDNFTLVQDGGRWVIANASWTIEPEGCPS